MDLSEYYLLYYKTVTVHLDKLRRCIRDLPNPVNDHVLVAAAAHAAHSIKGATWTIRDTPILLNDEPPDRRYDDIGALAEHLEHYLEEIISGTHQLDQALLDEHLSRLEAAIIEQKIA